MRKVLPAAAVADVRKRIMQKRIQKIIIIIIHEYTQWSIKNSLFSLTFLSDKRTTYKLHCGKRRTDFAIIIVRPNFATYMHGCGSEQNRVALLLQHDRRLYLYHAYEYTHAI